MPRSFPLQRPALTRAGRFVFILLAPVLGDLAGGARLAAQAAATVQGRVRDASGLPLAGVVVRLEPGAGRTTTDADGRWTIGGVAPGTYDVVVALPGSAVRRAVGVPREGETVRVDLVLPRGVVRLEEVLTLVDPARMPADRRVLTGADLQEAGSLPAALERVPGVFVKAYGVGGARYASIRGADPEATLVLWGEERLLAPGGGAVDLATIPSAALDSVEVVSRGASARWGEGAAGGVIRLHPASGSFSTGAAVDFRAGGGTLGRREAAAHVGLPVGRGGIALTGELRRYADAYDRDVNGDGRDVSLAAATQQPWTGIDASVALQAWERGSPGPVHGPTPEARIDGGRFLASAAHERPIGSWSLRGEAAFQQARSDYADPERPAFGLESRESALALRSSAGRDLGRHRVDGGLEVRRRDAGSTELGGHPVRWELGAWAGTRWSPAAVPGLSVSPHLRADAVRLDGEELDRRDGFLSPGLGAALELGSGLAVTAFAGRAYRYPAFESLFFLSGVAVRANPALREERSRDLEAGLDWRGPAGLTAAVTVFDRALDGTIVWLPDFRFVWSPRNLPHAVVRGAELRAAWRTEAGWEVAAAWTHAPARFDFPGNHHPLPYRPADLASLGIAFARGPARAALDARYTGRRYPNVAGTNALGSYLLVDAAVRWSRALAGGELELELRLENALDRAYDVVFGFPAPGRTLYAGLRWRDS